ncbi:MAG TPA: GTP 3',8-cyclase MoaA [Candidatus Macondimonas sp.]|nr:GTP 3',8-cyclase MoaA [Candidatus Macondimonas sp.]
MPEKLPEALVDRFGRRVDYVRLSVTDRCDFRCVYCMPEDARFVPRAEILTLEELLSVGKAFVALGVRRIRITGGEPLVRRDLPWLLERLAHLPGLDELTLTTNGSRLRELAGTLAAVGVRRLNVSLDSLRPERFAAITRVGKLERVLAGLEAARAAGFAHIRLNAVILKGRNEDEVLDLVDFARAHGFDIAFIEEMPLGEIRSHDRAESFYASDRIRADIARRYPLVRGAFGTGGPARYYHMSDSPTRIGFISPHSHNFCEQCNRVRVTAQGRLLLCLGQEHSVDLRAVLRGRPGDDAALREAIVRAMAIKPRGHDFDLAREVRIVRFMNHTGG